MQHEITSPIPLLNENGNLTEAGYARRLLPIYDRSKVKGGFARLKEWDYYLVSNGRYALALTIADNSYMGLDSISLLDFEENWQETKSPMSIFPMGRTNFPATSEKGDVSSSGRGHSISYFNDGTKRLLLAHMDKFHDGKPIDAKVTLTDAPEESMVICTPFDKPGHFYFNQKINCMRAQGEVSFNGRRYVFEPSDSFAVLDWGRGVWTYHNTWFWGTASGLVDGEPFGFNIGYGFGDTSAASENMLIYKGKAHKLSRVIFNIPTKDGKYDFMSPWTYTSDDGRFEMDFQPVMDRASCTDIKLIKSDQHQVFGRFTGKAILDDGTVLDVHNLMGSAEVVENKW